MTGKPVRIGIVGCGRILNAHLRGYRRLREAGVDSFRVTGLMSRNPADAWCYRKRGEGPSPRRVMVSNPQSPMAAPHTYVSDFQPEVEASVYNTLGEMLASDQVDALHIPASVAAHHEIVLAGLAAGKHCLVEKPLAITVKAGTLMVEEAKRRGLTLGVVEHARYEAPVRIARWCVDQGLLGTPHLGYWLNLGAIQWSPDRIVAHTPWRHHKLTAGAGASVDQGVHGINRLRQVLGEVEEVVALTRILERRRYTRNHEGHVVDEVDCDVDDTFFARLGHAGGAIGQISMSYGLRGEASSIPEGLVFYGSKGSLKGDRLVFENGDSCSAAAHFDSQATAEQKDRYFPYGLQDPFGLVELDFLRAIERSRPMEASGEEGLIDLACAYAICESSALNQAVQVRDVLSGKVSSYQDEINRHYGL